jgi:hypothetical protein
VNAVRLLLPATVAAAVVAVGGFAAYLWWQYGMLILLASDGRFCL